MPIRHSLSLEDFYEEEYSLIGIRTSLDDYKLAYLLNRALEISLKKEHYNTQDSDNTKDNLDFSLYSCTTIKYDFEWFLIANRAKQEKERKKELQFELSLFPEKEEPSFFIKICGNVNPDVISETIRKIKTIHTEIDPYQVDKDTLKSKDFLIF